MKHITGILILILVSTRVYGELTEMEIDEIRATYREKQIKIVSDALLGADSLKEWPSELDSLAEIMENETSDSQSFRWSICAEVYKHVKEIDVAPEKKRELVFLLTTRLNDRSSSIQGSVRSWLREFEASSFNEAAKRNIKERFDVSMGWDMILLMGVLDTEYCLTKTKHLVDHLDLHEEAPGRFWGKAVWAALLVHARFGDSTSIDRVLDAVEHERDEVDRVKTLFKHLGYVHQPKVVEYLKTQINEGRIIPGGDDYDETSYAQEACVVLSTMLKNFPKKAGGRFDLYTSSAMEYIKEWLSQQDKWEFVE